MIDRHRGHQCFLPGFASHNLKGVLIWSDNKDGTLFRKFVIDLTQNRRVFAPSDLHDGSRARLDDPHLLVLAAGGQQAAVGVEGHAEDDVGVAVDHLHRLPDLQVPDEDLSQLEKQ